MTLMPFNITRSTLSSPVTGVSSAINFYVMEPVASLVEHLNEQVSRWRYLTEVTQIIQRSDVACKLATIFKAITRSDGFKLPYLGRHIYGDKLLNRLTEQRLKNSLEIWRINLMGSNNMIASDQLVEFREIFSELPEDPNKVTATSVKNFTRREALIELAKWGFRRGAILRLGATGAAVSFFGAFIFQAGYSASLQEPLFTKEFKEELVLATVSGAITGVLTGYLGTSIFLHPSVGMALGASLIIGMGVDYAVHRGWNYYKRTYGTI